jgi:hypothetical protein
MINIPYTRSSMINTLDLCQNKFFIEYVLGHRGFTHFKAILGTCVHKCVEILAESKKSKQNQQERFSDNELGEFDTNLIITASDDTLAHITRLSFDYFTTKPDHDFQFTNEHYNTVLKWFKKVLNCQNGRFNPLNNYIISTEEQFTIPIEEDWAKFNNQYYTLSGTIDMVIQSGNSYECVDWKSGSIINWKTRTKKTYKDLMKDTQLNLYYYVLRKLYPDKPLIMTIFYINDGEQFSLAMDERNEQLALNIIKESLDTIRNMTVPLLKGNGVDFFCQKVCQFYKQPPDNTLGNNYCTCINNCIKKHGIDHVMNNYKQVGFDQNQYQTPGV